jgi:mannose-6-phosphate isomerase-like protein (cupin superfamily)
MSYTQDVGEVSARYRPSGEQGSVTYTKSGTVARFVAPGSATNGQFGLFEWNMQPNSGGPGAHFHKTFSESFYVMSGSVRLFNGEDWVNATKGDFLYVPEGGIHAFRNDSGEAASMLILFAPGPAREKYFGALAEIAAAGRTLSEDEWTALFAEHDQYRA